LLNADHGEGFGEHGKFYHGMTVFDEMVRVPLIIKPPGSLKKSKSVRNRVRNLDIMPTILDYCQLQIPKDCNGQSLRPLVEGNVSLDLPSISETYGTLGTQLVAFRHQGHKLIYDLTNQYVWLYDLQADPAEMNSLLPEQTSIMPSGEEILGPARQREQRMRQELLGLLGIKTLAELSTAGKDLPEIDERTKEQMKALGYVY
jgi:arylsulfatase A-like enzyme